MCSTSLPESEVVKHVQQNVVYEDNYKGRDEGANQGTPAPEGLGVFAQVFCEFIHIKDGSRVAEELYHLERAVDGCWGREENDYGEDKEVEEDHTEDVKATHSTHITPDNVYGIASLTHHQHEVYFVPIVLLSYLHVFIFKLVESLSL